MVLQGNVPLGNNLRQASMKGYSAGCLFFIGILGAPCFGLAQALSPDAAAGSSDAATICATKASEKKLSGAAYNSYTKKCVRDSVASDCALAAADKKIREAAKNSFTAKCIRYAIHKN